MRKRRMRRRRVASPKLPRIVNTAPKKIYVPIGYQSDFDDAALDRLHATREPQRCYSQEEIAAACGVTRQRVEQFERSALRKLRVAFEVAGFSEDEMAAAPVRDFFQRHPVHLAGGGSEV